MLRDMSPAVSSPYQNRLTRFSSPKLDSLLQAPRSREPASLPPPPRDTVSHRKLHQFNDRDEDPPPDLCLISLWQTPTLGRELAEETADYDRRGRNVRPREPREGSSAPPVPVPSLPPVPSLSTESAGTIIDILDSIYVQDIDADESGDKEKVEFKQECLTLVLGQMFDSAGMAEKVSSELGKSSTNTEL